MLRHVVRFRRSGWVHEIDIENMTQFVLLSYMPSKDDMPFLV